MKQHPTGKIPLRAMIRRDWKNPPNIVTSVRLLGSFALPPLTLSQTPEVQWIGFALFIFLAVSDYLDGWMAKKVFGPTDLGKMFDAVVDKVLLFIALFAALLHAIIVGDTFMTAALISAISAFATREIYVARIKILVHRRLDRIDSAIQSSRVAMVIESVAIAAQLIPEVSPEIRTMKLVLLGLAVGASLLSGFDYYWKYREYLR